MNLHFLQVNFKIMSYDKQIIQSLKKDGSGSLVGSIMILRLNGNSVTVLMAEG